MRRAELSINFVFVVILTLIVIVIVILFTATKVGFTQKIYCQSVNLLTQRELSSIAEDDPCKNYVKLQTSSVEALSTDDLTGDMVQHILDCWSRAGNGQSSESFLCEEVTIPDDYVFQQPVGEQQLTDRIVERQLCHIISNSDFGCGDDDNLVAGAISFSTNILIEYDGATRQVRIERP